MKRVLVTGGAGFIGSNVVKKVLREAHTEVIVLDNLLSGYRQNLAGLDVVFIQGDVRDATVVKDAMSGCDTVFHLAASVGNTRSIANPIQDSEINVIGTLRILETARELGVRKMVFSSSAGIFGELKTLPICEEHPVEPDSPYGASKLCAEKLSLAYSRLYPLECVCLRYFNVYGVNQRYDAYGNVIPIFAHCLVRGMPLLIYGDGEQTRDFVNVRDVAQANYMAALADGVSGAFNIASGTRITINRLAEMMCRASGIQSPFEHGSPRKGDVQHSLADISAARKVLGYEPIVGLEEGLAEYMEWAKREGA